MNDPTRLPTASLFPSPGSPAQQWSGVGDTLVRLVQERGLDSRKLAEKLPAYGLAFQRALGPLALGPLGPVGAAQNVGGAAAAQAMMAAGGQGSPPAEADPPAEPAAAPPVPADNDQLAALRAAGAGAPASGQLSSGTTYRSAPAAPDQPTLPPRGPVAGSRDIAPRSPAPAQSLGSLEAEGPARPEGYGAGVEDEVFLYGLMRTMRNSRNPQIAQEARLALRDLFERQGAEAEAQAARADKNRQYALDERRVAATEDRLAFDRQDAQAQRRFTSGENDLNRQAANERARLRSGPGSSDALQRASIYRQLANDKEGELKQIDDLLYYGRIAGDLAPGEEERLQRERDHIAGTINDYRSYVANLAGGGPLGPAPGGERGPTPGGRGGGSGLPGPPPPEKREAALKALAKVGVVGGLLQGLRGTPEDAPAPGEEPAADAAAPTPEAETEAAPPRPAPTFLSQEARGSVGSLVSAGEDPFASRGRAPNETQAGRRELISETADWRTREREAFLAERERRVAEVEEHMAKLPRRDPFRTDDDREAHRRRLLRQVDEDLKDFRLPPASDKRKA